ncbi:MAG: heme lyase CcmF/NrfE family subunit [Rhodospirillaceae bacterium]|nr:heme lyase CcmF/NrfE family subunit [Rhodospirillaceae bacterium]
MIPEIGHFALILALMLALAQACVPMAGAALGHPAMMETGRMAALAQLGAVAVAFFALMYAHAVSDFTVLNVVENSHSAKPMLYKLTGLWGNHEGSLVLWVLMLAAFGAAVAVLGGNLPPTLRARVLSVQGLIAVGFLSFMLFTSNPFVRVFPPPADGQDLNPILQDPGLAFHPPMLYAGYVGFSMAFSFAVAALIEGRVDAAWARWVRPWTLAAWIALTAGITLGSWWSYYELGWGGWWAWDPVENASFMPWLAGTALLHSAVVAEKREALKAWTILLAILTFALSLLGTFLVRSGAITSVHSFANDPARGIYILALLVVAVGGSLVLFAVRAPVLRPGGLFAPVSREGALVVNNVLLAVAAAAVFLGTLYPLSELVTGKAVTVGPPYYNIVFLAIMAPLVLVMPVGPLLRWKRGDLPGVLGRLGFAAGAALVAALAGLWLEGGPATALAALALAGWLLAGTVEELRGRLRPGEGGAAATWRRARALPRSAYGMSLAHLGIAASIIGMAATSAWGVDEIRQLAPGQSMSVAGYDLRLDRVDRVQGPNYTADRAQVTVRRDGRVVAVMQPEKRHYPVRGMTTTEAAIRSGPFANLYVVLGEPAPDGSGWAVRVLHHPLALWIWGGAGLMALGGLASLSDRRLRIGIPFRRARPAPAAAAE